MGQEGRKERQGQRAAQHPHGEHRKEWGERFLRERGKTRAETDRRRWRREAKRRREEGKRENGGRRRRERREKGSKGRVRAVRGGR